MHYQGRKAAIGNTPWGAPPAPGSVTIAGRQATKHETRRWTYWLRNPGEGDLNSARRGHIYAVSVRIAHF